MAILLYTPKFGDSHWPMIQAMKVLLSIARPQAKLCWKVPVLLTLTLNTIIRLLGSRKPVHWSRRRRLSCWQPSRGRLQARPEVWLRLLLSTPQGCGSFLPLEPYPVLFHYPRLCTDTWTIYLSTTHLSKFATWTGRSRSNMDSL